jgi:hypothetical protein
MKEKTVPIFSDFSGGKFDCLFLMSLKDNEIYFAILVLDCKYWSVIILSILLADIVMQNDDDVAQFKTNAIVFNIEFLNRDLFRKEYLCFWVCFLRSSIITRWETNNIVWHLYHSAQFIWFISWSIGFY